MQWKTAKCENATSLLDPSQPQDMSSAATVIDRLVLAG